MNQLPGWMTFFLIMIVLAIPGVNLIAAILFIIWALD